jgi:serine/threonine protein kinase/Flp pilus assembly protein TadD
MLGKTISHYRIVKQIGSGGMGVVYEAEDTVLHRRVAIKTIKDTGHQKSRLLREARAISRLNHPFIATVYDFGETVEGQPFIVMELIGGQTLDVFLKNANLDLPETIDVLIDVAAALAAAHKAGIVHRDVKPTNIIVTDNGNSVKVLDFGLSKYVEGSETDETSVSATFSNQQTITQEGVIMGTPLYLSPEQALGEKIDERSDIFSLGTLLYECLTGVNPFQANGFIEICSNILRSNPRPPSEFNSCATGELDRITLKAIAKNKTARYQSADELIKDLRAARETLSGEKSSAKTARQTPKTEESPSKTTVPMEPVSFVKNNSAQNFRQTFTDVLQKRRSSVLIFTLMTVLGASAFFVWQQRQNVFAPKPEAAAAYQKGIAAMNDGAFFAASKLFQRAVEQEPNYAMAQAKRAEALAELGYFNDAREARARANETARFSESSLSSADNLRLEAVNKTLDTDYEAAAANYRRIVEQSPDTEKAQAFLDLGRAHEKNENVAAAIESYENAVRLNSDLPAAHARLGVLSGREQNFERASAFFDSAERLYNLQNNAEGEIEVSYLRGSLLASKGDAVPAQAEIERALKKAEINEIPYQQIKCLLLLSRILRSSSRADDALPIVNQAVRLARDKDINNLHAQSVLELGTVYLFQDKIAEAEKSYDEAERLADLYDAVLIKKRVLLMKASAKIQRHKADEALGFLSEVEKFFEEGRYEKDLIDLLSIKARAVALKGDFADALETYRSLLEKSERVGDRFAQARALKGIGSIFMSEDDFSSALAPLQKSYAVYNSINKTLEAAYSLIAYGDALWQIGRYDEAQAALNQAAGFAEKHPQIKPRVDIVRARIRFSERKFDEAERFARDLVEGGAETPGDVKVEAKVLLAASRVQNTRAERVTLPNAAEYEDKIVAADAHFVAAEKMLQENSPAGALENAARAQRLFADLKKPTHEWQAWLLICQAQRKLQNDAAANEAAAKSDALFSTLSQKFSETDFQSYSQRPVVKFRRAQLLEISAVN